MKVGFTCGTFDLLHAGHVAMFAEAKQHCDRLIVGLLTDPTFDRPEKNKPIQSVFERFVQLSAVRWIDVILPYENEEELMTMMMMNPEPINIRFLGDDYKHATNEITGYNWCKDHGIEFYYCNRAHGFSSSDVRRRILDAEKKKNGSK